MTTMKKHRITGLKSLRRRREALTLEMEVQRAAMVTEVETLVWPLRVFRKFRKTAEDVADNKFFTIGVQLAQSILNAAWSKKKENEEHESHGIVDFLKQVADDFLANLSRSGKSSGND